MYSSQLLKGTFETIVLKLLAENNSLYGYEIIQKVKESSNGEINLPFGSIYPTLHKLERNELVTMSQMNIGKRVRLYYTITAKGRNKSAEMVEEFMRFARTMIMLLRPS
ncbi:MAG: PadR family transcriptional regulator [Bacteroidetes bacterium]|nr:PadR family transcriptional regulator [Bacteroidota bacterium]MDA1119451.1 PadR family transcriptional regulator [Bacteroidota bacterium]